MTRMDAKLLPSGGAECPVPGSPDRRPAVGLGRKLPKQKSKAMDLGDVGAQRCTTATTMWLRSSASNGWNALACLDHLIADAATGEQALGS